MLLDRSVRSVVKPNLAYIFISHAVKVLFCGLLFRAYSRIDIYIKFIGLNTDGS